MRTIISVFSHEPYAEEAIIALRNQGFQAEDISVMMKDHALGSEVERKTGAHVTKVAASGATTGALVGGAAGLLVGIGALTIPGIGALLVGGPLAAALGLTGTAATTITGAATGAIAGGLLGALMGLGLTRDEAEIYEERIKEGALLLAIPVTEDREGEVRTILSRYNASDITSVDVPTDRVRATSTRVESVDEYDTYSQEREQYAHRPFASMGTKGGRSASRKQLNRKKSSFRDE